MSEQGYGHRNALRSRSLRELAVENLVEAHLVSTKHIVLKDPPKEDKGHPERPASEKDSQRWTYRFVHEFAGHLPNLEVLEIWGADWTIRPPHWSIHLAMSRFSFITQLVLRYCNLPSSQMLRGMVSALNNSLIYLELFGTRWPSAHHDHLSAYIARTPGPALIQLRIACPGGNENSVAAFLRWLSFTPTQRSLRYLQLSQFLARLSDDLLEFLELVSPGLLGLYIACSTYVLIARVSVSLFQ